MYSASLLLNIRFFFIKMIWYEVNKSQWQKYSNSRNVQPFRQQSETVICDCAEVTGSFEPFGVNIFQINYPALS